MVTTQELTQQALAFPETTQEPHFEKTSFRVRKKIFATYDPENQTATLKLNEADQHIFSLADAENIYPVQDKWAKQGWTIFLLKSVKKELLISALRAAYCHVAPKTLSGMVQEDLDL